MRKTISMNQNLRLKTITILLIALSTFLGCKQASTKNHIDVTGFWSWEYSDLSKPYLNKTFTLDLNQVGNDLGGRYCAIAKNGARMDCYHKNKTDNVTGIVKGDTIFIDFKGHYDREVSGKGILYKKEGFLVWTILEEKGDIYAPKFAELKKGKLDIKKETKKPVNNQVSSTCKYSNNCSCKENDSGKSIYEDSLQITCTFNTKSFNEVYNAIYKTESSLKGFLLEKLPAKSLIHSTADTFSTDYKIKEKEISIYISQENGGFEFILKVQEGKIVIEKHAFPG